VGNTIFKFLSDLFAHYGYWVIFFGVLLENLGVPLPGETVLLFAGFLAFRGKIELAPAIVVGALGCGLGGTLGYLIGDYGGRPFVERYLRRHFLVRPTFDRSERLFLHYGQWAVFFGRFVVGLRMFAGILAGLFRMPLRRFTFFNFAGAIAWTMAVTCAGFVFGRSWRRVVGFVVRLDRLTLEVTAAAILVGLVIYFLRSRTARNS
jgi:membrane protein DedA with SNARE-associated domain